MPRAVHDFILWCAEYGVEIDPRLEIRVSPSDRSVSVFSKPDASVDIGESLVRIPKSIVFSTKNCFRSRDLSALARDDPNLELSLALLTELLSGPESRWHAYFQTLPSKTVDTAVFWGVNDDPDGIEARKWIKGTEVEKILTGSNGRDILGRVNAYFDNAAQPFLCLLGLPSSLNDFYRAYSLVSSRAFLVDAYHGLSLVPVADAFNHVEDNHVHLESDYHVCTTCGSLYECSHDVENPRVAPGSPSAGSMDADTCEMVSNLPIGPGEEVFNTYEKGLTNAQLLCQYGFALDVNENNLVAWTIDELLRDDPERDATLSLWTDLVTQWPRHVGWDESQLVYNPPCGETMDEDGVPRRTGPISSLLVLNADGQISHQLWLMLLALALPDFDRGPAEAPSVARQVSRIQELLEVSLARGLTPLGPGSSSGGDRHLLRVLSTIAASVVEICDAKIGSAHCPGISDTCLGDLLEETPPDRPLTRCAIAYALEERKSIQTCRRAWSDIAEL